MTAPGLLRSFSSRLGNFGSSDLDGAQSCSREHCGQSYYEVSYISSGDNGDTYCAISKKVANQIAAKHLWQKTQAYHDELRKNLVAVKYCKDAFEENDLGNEIMLLTQDLPAKHSGWTPCVDSHLDDVAGIQWLALPFYRGGDLAGFMQKFPHAISRAFRWHVACQLAKAMLTFLYGVEDRSQTQPQPGWPRVSHSDVFTGNILLQAQSNGGELPDVVIADFGRARAFDLSCLDVCSTCSLTYLESQAMDVSSIVIVLDDLKSASVNEGTFCECSKCMDDEVIMEDLVRRLASFGPLIDTADCIAMLQEVVALADVELKKNQRRMPADALVHLRSVKISNEKLEAAIGGKAATRRRCSTMSCCILS